MKILITESQLKYLITEGQKIKVTDFCGRTKEVDHQQWWYNGGQTVASYVKCYKFDGTSFVFNDWGCEFRNWSTMTEQERKTAIEGKKRNAGCGTADRFGAAAFLKEVITFENVVDIISMLLELIPGFQVFGKAIDIAQAISYFVKAFMSTTAEDIASNLVNGIFQTFSFFAFPTLQLPGFVKKIITKIKKALDSVSQVSLGTLSLSPKWYQIAIAYVKDQIGNTFDYYMKQVVIYFIKPIIDYVMSVNSWLANTMSKVIKTLQDISNDIGRAGELISSIKKQDPNAFT